jgi:3-oxoacyl-[acyl-carrier-protein] synthase III
MIVSFKEEFFSGIQIKATTSSFPKEFGNWYSNEDIHKLKFGKNWKNNFEKEKKDPDYFLNIHGFKKRFWINEPNRTKTLSKYSTEDLMLSATGKLFSENSIQSTSIDLLITVTTTSNKYTSTLASSISNQFGMKANCLEIKAGCSSMLSALSIAYQYLGNGLDSVLIVCAETYSKLTNLNSNFLYGVGDGAAAILLKRNNLSSKPIFCFLETDSSLSNSMGVEGTLPPTKQDFLDDKYFLKMNSDIAPALESKWKEIPKKVYANSKIKSKDIACFIPHQVNKAFWETAVKASKISKEKAIYTLPEYGNCGSVTILLALDYAIRNGKIKRGDTIFLAAVGGGVSYGGFILEY